MTSAEMYGFHLWRQPAKKTAALMRAAENALESPIKASGSDRRARLEDLDYRLGAALESVNAIVEAGAQLERDALAVTAAIEEA